MADHEYKIPEDCHYTESDEWLRVDGAVVRIVLLGVETVVAVSRLGGHPSNP